MSMVTDTHTSPTKLRRTAQAFDRFTWRELAACAGYPTDWWHPVQKSVEHEAEETKQARRICGSCPVRGQCFEFGQSANILDPQAIYGGMNKAQRNRESKRLGKGHQKSGA